MRKITSLQVCLIDVEFSVLFYGPIVAVVEAEDLDVVAFVEPTWQWIRWREWLS
jgi:hypothetical protein